MTMKAQNFRTVVASSLRLNDYWVDELSIKSNDEWLKESADVDPQARYKAERFLSDDGDKVVVRLEISSPRTPKTSRPYTFKIVMHGVFQLPERTPGDEKAESLNSHLTQFNTVAVLYGVARGILANSSALNQNGSIQLPTANFIKSEQR
ncbi:MAG: hypothetical protein IH960_04905 [Chloroflexi bacterium]|nr:hypothetical protein [Chloroflexota bacterium]